LWYLSQSFDPGKPHKIFVSACCIDLKGGILQGNLQVEKSPHLENGKGVNLTLVSKILGKEGDLHL
jgi:hypothetical protein